IASAEPTSGKRRQECEDAQPPQRPCCSAPWFNPCTDRRPHPIRPPPDSPCANGQPAIASLACCTIDGSVRPWFTLRADVGDGVGFRNGFTSGEAFLPVWQCPGEFV